MHEALAALGIEWPASPLNLSVLLAMAAAVAVYLLLWRSQPGYAIRAVGHAPEAAHYGGMRPRVQIMVSMALSGALAGLVGINEIAGVHGRLLLEYVVGAGFAGIAVSLIGRNHPVGIVLAALLFGALYQGGSELAFEIPGFSRDMVLHAARPDRAVLRRAGDGGGADAGAAVARAAPRTACRGGRERARWMKSRSARCSRPPCAWRRR